MKPCLLGLLLLTLSSVAMAGADHFLLKVLPRGSLTHQRDGYFPVTINEDAAIHAARPGGSLWVPLPDGAVHLIYRNQIVHSDGTWTFVGALANVPDATKAVITFGNHAVFGAIPTQQGMMWSLITLHGKTWVVDTKALLSGAIKAPSPALPSPGAMRMQAVGAKAALNVAAPVEATADNPATVDLLVVYTQGFRDVFGSTEAAVARINYVVDLTNQAFRDSGVHGQIRLVHAAEVPYPDSSGITTLKDLMGTGPNGVPASLASVAPMREEYGADAVTLMQAFNDQTVLCAGAGSMGRNLAPITASDAPNAYSFVDDHGDYNCGSLPGYGLAEILGSNFGLVPDIAFDPNNDGAYPFSHAYSTQVQAPPNLGSGATGTGYTLMGVDPALPFEYVVRWPYFSNPDISLCNGNPCGIPDQSDAARSLNLTLPTIAAFEQTRVPVPRLPVQDVNGDGDSDLLWMNAGANSFGYWLMNGSKSIGSWAIAVASGYRVVATGDFNGDGLADVIWTSPADDLYLWSSNGSGFDAKYIGTYPADDVIVGTGDLGGDGKSDLLFLNPQTGAFTYWLMSGATIVGKATQTVAAGYTIGAIGDFNGDGRVDVVWTSAKRDLYLWTSTGSGFNAYYIGTYPAGWTLVGAGDVNGDGRSDLLWRNQGAGLFGYWIMNGATQVTGQAIPAAGNYSIAAIGDFDGDGKVDVMWTSSALDLYLWTSNGSSFTSKYVGTYPAGWSTIPSQLMSAGKP